MTMTRSRPLPLLDDLPEPSTASTHVEHDRGFGALETARGRLPLTALDVEGRIDGLLSQATVRQTFVNATDEPLEATYIFPLPDRAAVTYFRMEVAGRVVEGVLKERGQARREEERPGVFSLRVGNLMPGDVATIALTMVGVLPYSDGEVTFRFPLVVAPRYMPGVPLIGPSVGAGTAVDTKKVPDASRISPPVLLPGFRNPVRLSLTIDVYEPADDLRVSLFTVLGEAHGAVRTLTLQPGERLDRDFILRFRLGNDGVQTSLSLHPDADAGAGAEGTFALTIVPPVLSLDGAGAERPRDVVLLLDRSGSMTGWKMVAARRAMARMVDTLRDGDRFAVLAFDHHIETPRLVGPARRLAAATDRNRFMAVEFLAKVEPQGGTEMAEPLDEGVRLLNRSGDVRDRGRDRDGDPDRDRILVLVTDGQIGHEDVVLGAIGGRLKGIRVFTLGIDRAVNEGFLRRLAELGEGGSACELVESEDRLDEVMESIHRRIGTAVVTDVHLEPGESGLDFVADTLVPARAPSLFAGSPLLIMGRYRGRPRGMVKVCGQGPSGQGWCEAVAPSVRDNPAIAAAWARGQVRQLEDRYAAGKSGRASLERAIVATSLRFGVLCRFTAYVAVDRAAVVNEGGEAHAITQPVEMPAGWGKSDADSVVRLTVARRAAAPVPPPPPSPPGDPFERAGIELLETIGQDEHGTVRKARDKSKRWVTVRVLKKPVALESAAAVLRLERALKALKHPAIVPILKLIGEPGTGRVIAVVSEYIEASPLSRRVGPSGLDDPQAAAKLVLILADAVDYATRRQAPALVAPANLVLDSAVQPRIVDFGLASLGCGPDGPSARPDDQAEISSLGVILNWLLTGALPAGDGGEPLIRAPRALDPRIPVELETISGKAMAAGPGGRYATVAELCEDLRQFLGMTKPGLLGRITGRLQPKPKAPAPKGPAFPAPPPEQEPREDFWK
jgi:Ca-activated chloride channel family protein